LVAFFCVFSSFNDQKETATKEKIFFVVSFSLSAYGATTFDSIRPIQFNPAGHKNGVRKTCFLFDAGGVCGKKRE